MKTITVKIDVMKIDKARLFEGKNGAKYLDAVIFINDQPDQYGNDGMIVQSVTKDEKAAGVKGAILGNVKILARKPEQATAQPKKSDVTYLPLESDGLPF